MTAYSGSRAADQRQDDRAAGGCGHPRSRGVSRGAGPHVDPSIDDSTGTLAGYTQKISAARALLANPDGMTVDDVGLTITNVSLNTPVPAATMPVTPTPTPYTATTIVDATADTSLTYTRTTDQIIAIVTGGGTITVNNASVRAGVFFPAGLNGTIA